MVLDLEDDVKDTDIGGASALIFEELYNGTIRFVEFRLTNLKKRRIPKP